MRSEFLARHSASGLVQKGAVQQERRQEEAQEQFLLSRLPAGALPYCSAALSLRQPEPMALW
jgi:hypothetical protein